MDVGVRELKSKLSAYLARAAAGELITVTDRGRPVAVLAPPPGAVDLTAAAKAGWLAPATATATALGPVRRHAAAGTVLAAVTDDRNE